MRQRAIDLADGNDTLPPAPADPLTRLPEPQREAITLAVYGRLTHAEISTQLGLPAATVKGRMRLGLRELQEHLRRGLIA